MVDSSAFLLAMILSSSHLVGPILCPPQHSVSRVRALPRSCTNSRQANLTRLSWKMLEVIVGNVGLAVATWNLFVRRQHEASAASPKEMIA